MSHTPRRSVGRSSFLGPWQLGFLHFGTRPGRPSNAPQPMPLKPRHWNFNLPSIRTSIHPTDVAPARDDDRYGIAPPSLAEVAAAMQGTSGRMPNSLTQQDQAADGTQGSQVPAVRGRSTQTTQEHLAAATEEQSEA